MTHEIICADVLEWAESYDGEPFHAILCDPPYHLTDVHTGGVAVPGEFGQRTEAQKQARSEARGGFMGKAWDGGDIAYRPETWATLAQHLHPGGFIMAFASSRGWHRLAVAIEDAGLVIHPSIFGWASGSGFPKSTRIDRQLQKRRHGWDGKGELDKPAISNETMLTMTLEERSAIWQVEKRWPGHRYGLQAMKPSLEPIIVAQKPYAGKPVDSITKTGAGTLWIDGGRIGHNEPLKTTKRTQFHGTTYEGRIDGSLKDTGIASAVPSGRWPANLYLSHSPQCVRIGERRVKGIRGGCTKMGGTFGTGKEVTSKQKDYADADGLETVAAWRCTEDCPVRRLGEQSGESRDGVAVKHNGVSSNGITGWGKCPPGTSDVGYGGQGTAARFYFNADWSHEVAERLATCDPVMYQAKAGRKERDAGLEGMALTLGGSLDGGNDTRNGKDKPQLHLVRNSHPTVKPIALARWLATLLLPPELYAPRRILVPFAGSGSEMIGAILAGWENVTGIEMETEYVEIAEARLVYWASRPIQRELL